MSSNALSLSLSYLHFAIRLSSVLYTGRPFCYDEKRRVCMSARREYYSPDSLIIFLLVFHDEVCVEKNNFLSLSPSSSSPYFKARKKSS